MTTYLIEAYVAGGDVTDLEDRARTTAAEMTNEGQAIHYLGSVLIPTDETCFHLVQATSRDAVVELAHRANLGRERIVEAVPSRSPATSGLAAQPPLRGGSE